MSKWPVRWRIILTLISCVIWSGCLPMTETPLDEEKDPNFIEGKNHQNAMDYKSAIEAFERAVQANPRNAAAHFELGLLYDQKNRDYVAAIYHYQKHLQLRPKSEYAEAIKPMITACKLELAKTVTFGVVTREVHRDMERMTNDMALMRQQNEALRAQLAAKPMVLTQWMTLRVTNFVGVPVRTTNVVYAQPQQPAATNYVARSATNVARAQAPQQQPRANTGASQLRAPRVHRVGSGESLSVISRRYGVSIERIQAANRGLDPRRIRAGQTITIPQ